MNFDDQVDPEILARHQAVFDDLAGEIDALDSDGEDDGYQPQSKPAPKNNPKPVAQNKRQYADPDDDLGFPKFDNAAFKELEQGFNKKNNFNDLEKEIMDLDSDGDEPSARDNKPRESFNKQPTNFTKPAASKQVQEPPRTVTKPANETKPQGSPQKPAIDNAPRAAAKSTTVAFPLNHFTGSEPKKLIDIDNKIHGKDNLMTLALVNYEIEEIIDPCLSSASVNVEIKSHLEAKKKSLLVFKTNITNLFQKGDLNPTKYLQLVAKMKTANIKVAQDLQKVKLPKESERVKERLKILVDEEQEYVNKPQSQGGSGPVKSSARAASKTETQKKAPTLADSLRPAADTKINKILPSEIDCLSSEELLSLLRKRKDEYWNLATYINKEILKFLEGNELNQKKQYLQNSLLPLIQRSSKYIENFDDTDSGEIGDFLKDKLVEVTPALLHGKSLQDRSADIQKLLDMLEVCTNEETDYIGKLKATADDSNQGATAKKIKDGEKALEKYAEYSEYLSKLNSDKFMWVPTPKVVIGKEQRTVSAAINRDVDPKSMLIRFKKLENLTHRKYWIKWTIDAANGPITFSTPNCDDHSMNFNYQQLVQLTHKEKIDQAIENKEIRVEVLYKQMFVEKKKAEGAIPLSGLRKTNNLEGKVKIRNDGIELHYALRVREPLLKHLKTEVATVHSFQIFNVFDKNALVVQAPAPEKKPPAAQEEKKTQEPAAPAKLFEKKKYPPLVLLPQANDPLSSLTEQELPAGVSLELAKDPSNPDLIDCLTVLKMLAEELEKARTGLAVEGRRNDNKVVSDNWTKALRKATILEAKFGSGDIDPGQYCDILKAALDKDQKLIQLYKAKGDNDRLAFVMEKMSHTNRELKELEEALAAEGEGEES